MEVLNFIVFFFGHFSCFSKNTFIVACDTSLSEINCCDTLLSEMGVMPEIGRAVEEMDWRFVQSIKLTSVNNP
jgi:hypothetical protein